MKRFVVILLLLLCMLPVAHSMQQDEVRSRLDSAKRVSLDAKLTEYVAAIEAAGPDVQKEEADFLIDSVSDSLMRQYVALKLYDHYLNSKAMGSESVAIYILDNWFFNGNVKMHDEVDLINARVYADFNRRSLVGNIAPQLSVEDIAGDMISLYDKPSARYSILYFYDTDCSKCKVETILLKGLLQDEEYSVDLYPFYVGDNGEAWRKYVGERFSLEAPWVNVRHVWDPTIESDFQRKYGVLQTPGMYLIRPDGKIIGRGLDVRALAQMLDIVFSDTVLEYGSDASSDFLSQLFSGEETSEEEVRSLADMVAGSTLQKGDTVMFRQMTGDMLYYLSSERGSGYKEGLAYVIDEYILNPSIKAWRTSDDSLKVVGFARIMDELLSKSVPGSRIADVKVPGVLLANGKEVLKNANLRKLGGNENVILFHTEGCHICKAEIDAARKLVADRSKVRVYLVDVDDIILHSPSLAGRLFDAFDLSSLPFVIITNKKGIIQKRYTTLQK